jgi:hypothetical protein
MGNVLANKRFSLLFIPVVGYVDDDLEAAWRASMQRMRVYARSHQLPQDKDSGGSDEGGQAASGANNSNSDVLLSEIDIHTTSAAAAAAAEEEGKESSSSSSSSSSSKSLKREVLVIHCPKNTQGVGFKVASVLERAVEGARVAHSGVAYAGVVLNPYLSMSRRQLVDNSGCFVEPFDVPLLFRKTALQAMIDDDRKNHFPVPDALGRLDLLYTHNVFKSFYDSLSVESAEDGKTVPKRKSSLLQSIVKSVARRLSAGAPEPEGADFPDYGQMVIVADGNLIVECLQILRKTTQYFSMFKECLPNMGRDGYFHTEGQDKTGAAEHKREKKKKAKSQTLWSACVTYGGAEGVVSGAVFRCPVLPIKLMHESTPLPSVLIDICLEYIADPETISEYLKQPE